MSGEKPATPPAANNGSAPAGGCVGNCDAATPFEKKYATAEDAAVAALQHEQPNALATDSEVAGRVQRNPDGTFTPRAPNAGGVDSSNPGPKGPNDVAAYHTHGAYNTDYDSENFSRADRSAAQSEGAPEYISTPSGAIKRYDPADGSTTTLPQTADADPNIP